MGRQNLKPQFRLTNLRIRRSAAGGMWRSADAVRALYYPQTARIRGAEGQARSPEASPAAKRRGVPERIRDVRRSVAALIYIVLFMLNFSYIVSNEIIKYCNAWIY